MAWYSSGTIAVSNGSAAIVGTGTDFVENVKAGDAVRGPDDRLYQIASVVSATSITLTRNYAGSTASGQAYEIIPLQDALAVLAKNVAELIEDYQSIADNAGQGMFGDGSAGTPGVRFAADQDTGFFRPGSNVLAAAVGGAEIYRITASGFGIGTTSPNEKLHVGGAGSVFTKVSTTTAGTNGSPVEFGTKFHGFNDYAKAWIVATDRSSDTFASDLIFYLNIGGGASTLVEAARFSGSGAHLLPGADNARNLGSGSLRFGTIYAGTGEIDTSDEAEKQQIGAIPEEWLDAWGDVEWSRYKFNDAVALKGDDARWHLGLIAQQVHAAFAAHEIDAFAIGLCCRDAWDAQPARAAVLDDDDEVIIAAQPAIEAGERWGLRYSECMAIEAAWQRRHIAQIEARLALLEGA